MKIALVLVSMSLAGCMVLQPAQQSSTPPIQTKIVDKGCEWVKFISASPDDTPETKRQIIAHDKAFISNCPDAPR
ncbi:hypothetical protein HDG34_005933 [Paraburkholderia sp. HC6.4b]|uniref:hypothetical protein n=1 Tax=unclassified Paraburkholderia TaxID=2615204 RepID=UPI001616DAAF|nr:MULTISPECIES: hypothetical protein [unclassified Paraburkholderia]MBB5411967.1 hypothetical protein [Paraburkholderia sp. HC6.4b]MBB5454034.1 hypothetical protein [Paraburkholderia sp. Kb1A]